MTIFFSLQEEHSFSCEDWDDSGEDEEPQFPDDDQDQDNDSLVGEETAFVQELEEIIEELNKEKSEILDGFSQNCIPFIIYCFVSSIIGYIYININTIKMSNILCLVLLNITAINTFCKTERHEAVSQSVYQPYKVLGLGTSEKFLTKYRNLIKH